MMYPAGRIGLAIELWATIPLDAMMLYVAGKYLWMILRLTA